MTDELSPRAREIVDAAREADGPTEADRRRVRAAVFAAIGAGAATSGAATAQAATATSAAGTSAVPVSVKVLAVAAAVAAIGVGGYVVTRGDDPAPAPTKTAPHQGDQGQGNAATAPLDRQEPAVEPEPELQAAPAPEPEMEFEPDHIRAPKRAPSTIEAERQLLVRARSMRRSGNAREALALLDDYRRKFSGGALRQERSALRVLVLCDLGNTAVATREARRFLRKWPGSVQARRIQSSCAGAALSPGD